MILYEPGINSSSDLEAVIANWRGSSTGSENYLLIYEREVLYFIVWGFLNLYPAPLTGKLRMGTTYLFQNTHFEVTPTFHLITPSICLQTNFV